MNDILSAPIRCLLVDDEALASKRVSMFVQKASDTLDLNIQVEVCNEPEKATDLVNSGGYDLILLDYELGRDDLTGMDLLRQASRRDPDIAAIMITGRGDEEIAVEAMKLGAGDYLVKDHMTSENLQRAINAAINRRQLRQTVRQQQEDLQRAERERVMLESVGATCHYFSQPLTSLLVNLQLLIDKGSQIPEKEHEMVRECLDCAERMQELLKKFQSVREYRTRPYTRNVNILDIGTED